VPASEPSVETLESAGLVAVYFYDDVEDRHGKTLLWPDEADTLAAKLTTAAQEIRDV
jgi:hypothetical protein